MDSTDYRPGGHTMPSEFAPKRNVRHAPNRRRGPGIRIDPAAGKIMLREWATDWLDALDVAIRTEDFYRSLLKIHILPQWGEHGIADISGIKVAAWANKLRADGYSPTTISGITKFLSLVLADAAVANSPDAPRWREPRS
ncbi:hypothetical protein WEH80_26650 [Actinomycetes bacterium KLBMP 9759]